MLMVAILSIGLLYAVNTKPQFLMQREQEGEMIHRGVQYSRAIRAYYKKFGRYPTKLEDLDNTNNLRYLRKHYKDPLNKNKDFRLLHYGEQGVTLGGGLSFGGGQIPGANAIGSPNGLNGSGQNGGVAGSGFGNSSFGGGNSAFGSSAGTNGVNTSGVFAQSLGNTGNSNGTNSNTQSGSGSNSGPNSGQGTNGTPGSDATSDTQAVGATGPNGSGQGTDASSSGQQVVASGPIVGVASVVKDKTIREYNKKKKYNEWQFLYDPMNEPRAGLITTPNQPQLQGFGTQNGMQPGQNGGQPGSASSSPFGQSSSFGNSSSSFGNNSGSSSGNSSSFGNNSNSNTPQPPANSPAPQ
jgi:hypothetical protein